MRLGPLEQLSYRVLAHPVAGIRRLLLDANHLGLGAKTYQAGRVEVFEDASLEGGVPPKSCGPPGRESMSRSVRASRGIVKRFDGQ